VDVPNDPVLDDAAYQEFHRFFADVHQHMKLTGSSIFRLALATHLSRTTLDHYFADFEKGRRFRISEDVAGRLAGWADLKLTTYRFARVPRGGTRRQAKVVH
jgi:hypothetical protein